MLRRTATKPYLMMKRDRLVPVAFALLLYAPLSVSPARADRVDDYVREQMRLRHVPGLALAVVRDGRIIKESGYGLASIELEVPVSSSRGSAGRTEAGFDCCSTPHNIGSRGHSRFSQSTILTLTEVT